MSVQQLDQIQSTLPLLQKPAYLACRVCVAAGVVLNACENCHGTGNEPCEQCGNPIPIVATNARRLLKNNVAAKRFCSNKCRSFKYWQDHKEQMQQRRKGVVA